MKTTDLLMVAMAIWGYKQGGTHVKIVAACMVVYTLARLIGKVA
ncbi:hypothetical protein [Phascolarctobacterium succinatutens]|nr:hypothetical protein [Phascolarctobacterium succinatutens]